MPIRMTGLISNMDTESIIKELMSAQSLKKTKVENKITKLEWKQEKWKDLNKKIYALYTGTLTKMKTEGNYQTKKAVSSNESKLTVSATVTAAEGTHQVSVQELASSQYVTGGKLADYLNGEGEMTGVTAATKLSDLGFAQDGSGVIRIKTKGAETASELAIDEYTTISDFVQFAKNAGVNASFDAGQKRIFISAKGSGTDGAFELTSGATNSGPAREAVKNALDYDNMKAVDRTTVNNLLNDYKNAVAEGDSDTLTEAQESLADIASNQIIDRIKKETEEQYQSELASPEDFDAEVLDGRIETALEGASAEIEQKGEELALALSNYTDAIDSEVLTGNTGMQNLGLADVTYTEDTVTGAITYGEFQSGASGATLVQAKNGEITYNGASFTGSSNSYSINGMSFTVNNVTNPGENITVNVAKDTDTVYNMVKGFIKEYNELLTEMNTLYGAKSAKGYEPLTDEEREAMSDDQIEKWETKIKDSLLRSDSTLNSLLSTMKTTMAGSVEVEGKRYALSSFGITMGLYTEKGQLHILGDSEDTYGATYDDKLRKAIADNPETVMTVLTGIAKNLYSEMSEKMRSSSLNSALTFYNDKQLDKTMSTYKTELSTLEDRLTNIEDRYYKQFTAMETAMSRLTSQQNSLAAMLGTSVQQ